MILQHRSPRNRTWHDLVQFETADTEVAYTAAVGLSQIGAVSWRVLGSDGRVVAVFDGVRWRSDGASTGVSAWWDGPRGTDSRPAPLDNFPDTMQLRGPR